MSGTPEIEEVKKVTELKSRLRAVSEVAGQWGTGSCGQNPKLRTLPGSAFFSVLQLAEALSRCSHRITETQSRLSNLSSELLKNRDQVHADRRSVGFSSSGR